MIEVIRGLHVSEEGGCSACNKRTTFVNVVAFERPKSSMRTIFRLCGACLKELKEKIG